MSSRLNRSLTWVSLVAAIALASCGGGGGGSGGSTTTSTSLTGTTTSTSLTGTAATGAAISGIVYVVDSQGQTTSTTSNSSTGVFTVNVAGMTAPFILSVIGTSGGKQVRLASVATSVGQTVNITPLTDLIVSAAAGRPAGSALIDLCTPVSPSTTAPSDCTTALSLAADSTRLNTAVSAVMEMISTINPGTANPLTDAFTADGTGMDKVLDQILVTPATTQGDTATVTLIATNTQIGSVALDSTTGVASTATATPASATQATAADTANTALSEIKTCISAFNALYAPPLSAPSLSRVSDFLDASFSHGSLTQSTFAAAFSSGGSEVVEGFRLDVAGFAPKDMAPFSTAEINTIDFSSSNIGTTQRTTFNARTTTAYDSTNNVAWVTFRPTSDALALSFKMIKGSAYTGCPGGWKMGGTLRTEAHMSPRISRNANGSYTRSWPFHITKANAISVGGNSAYVTIRGPGLAVYSGDASAPVGDTTRLKLVQRANNATMVVADGQTYYGTTDAIESCQDLAALSTPPAAGTPCINETTFAPGKIYFWTVMSNSTTAASVFPFEAYGVPMSTKFAAANSNKIFASITSVSPSSASALNALKGTDLTGQITFNYTQNSTYGSKMNHCGIVVWTDADTSSQVLSAEQAASGQETSCTFSSPESIASNFNSNSFGFSGNVTSAYIRVVTTTLGNQAGYSQQLP